MLYRPVKVHHIISVQYAPKKPGQTPVKPTPFAPATARNGSLAATGKVVEFWRVSCNLFGECGHEHKTEAGAERCKKRFEKRWHEHRSKQAKKAAKKRKSWVTRMAGQRLEGIGAVLVD
jgi:hypothetical protein